MYPIKSCISITMFLIEALPNSESRKLLCLNDTWLFLLMLASEDNSKISLAQFCDLHLLLPFDTINTLEVVHSQINCFNLIAEPVITQCYWK